MKSRLFIAAALCAAIVLMGCVDDSTVITVNPDGSGTIEKTIIVSKNLVKFIMDSGMAQGNEATVEKNLLNENSLKLQAGKMGQDVSFVSAQKISADKGNGYKAVYSFKDISKVKLEMSPAGDIAMQNPSGTQSAPEYITFAFAKGAPASLTIASPKPKAAAAQQQQQQYTQKELDDFMTTMRPLYADLRIQMSITVKGKIAETNATYVSGSTVTLADLDFSKILADDAAFKKLASSQTQSVSEAMAMVKAVPGVKLETKDSVTVKFQ
jgi:hypothetical protein